MAFKIYKYIEETFYTANINQNFRGRMEFRNHLILPLISQFLKLEHKEIKVTALGNMMYITTLVKKIQAH